MNYKTRAKRSGWRKTLRKYQGNLCCWCKEPMQTKHPNRWDFETLDHLKPRALGGYDKLSNLALAHAKCNNERPCRQDMPHHRGRISPKISEK